MATPGTHSTKWLPANTVNEQVNPNLAKQNHWSDTNNIVGYTNKYGSAKYTRSGKKGKYTYKTPYVVTAHEFKITEDIVPQNAYITKVEIECKFKATKGLKVKAPAAYFMIYGGSGKVSQATKGKTGWYNSYYVVYPSATVGTSDTIVTYSIPGSEWNKMKYPTKQLYNSVMGIDLHFQTPTSMSSTTGTIYMKYVRIKIHYEVFEPKLTWSPIGTADNPIDCTVNKNKQVCIEYETPTNVGASTQEIDINLPFGLELVQVSDITHNSSFEEVDAFNGNYKWYCPGTKATKSKICLTVISHTVGLKQINAVHNNVAFPQYLYPAEIGDQEYSIARVTPIGEIKEGRPSCFKFEAKVQTASNLVQFNVNLDGEGTVDHSKISSEVKEQYNNNNNGNYHISWELSPASQVDGVSIEEYNNNSIVFYVPDDDAVIEWTGCFIPMNTSNTLVLTNVTNNTSINYPYKAIPLDTILEMNFEDVIWYDNSVLATVETDSLVLNCGVAPFDKIMYEGECTLTAYLQKPVKYIGCVEVQHSHYEPDSDYSNGLVKNQYKNKTYMGKKGEIDEDISLKIKLPPQDWTTLQGLTKLDRPVPVNLVPEAFEGDVLNHRGWVELYGVKGVKKTNPLYYDGQLEVAYLTHNINSRFEVVRGDKSYNGDLPSLLAPVLDSGEEFANYYYINEDGEETSNATGYFDVNTDGSYVFDDFTEDDDIDNPSTLIALDNGQFATITSTDLLTEQAQIIMEWNCSKLREDKENNVERIITLTDSDGKIILEYEYFDFEYIETDEYYTCKVECRVREGDEWVTKFTKDLNLAFDIESLQLTVNEFGEVVQEPEPSEDELEEAEEETTPWAYNDYLYGSILHFDINKNKVIITDEGYNGREIYEEINIPSATYKYAVSWKNKNTDGENNELLTFFDFEVQESILTSDLTNDYDKIVISSFPVINKKLLFTRNSQEGTLYYWKKEDDSPFTYIQEPFYMYFCGVDLKANNEISIFDLNNSYTIFYLQNGLVRIGFNRLNGDVYLAKYDLYTRQYLNVTQLELTNNVAFKIGDYSDDKIEVINGTTVFTMYRGHPYVIINHKDDDIKFSTIWNKVWAESVDNDDPLDFPSLWNLINDDNLLPECVGGSNVSKSCLEFYNPSTGEAEPYENPISSPSLTLTQETNPVIATEDVFFSIEGNVTEISEEIPILVSYEGDLGSYESYVEVDKTIPYSIKSRILNSVIQSGTTIAVQGIIKDYNGDGINGKTIYFYEYYEPMLSLLADKSIIQKTDTLNLSATLKDSNDGSVIQGENVYFYVEE